MRKSVPIENLTSEDFEQRVVSPKILLFDIETAANEGKFWSRPWQTSIIKITQHTHMIAWSAKWLGGKQVTKALPDYEGYVPGSRDDKALVTELWGLLEQADMIVGHNSDKFDIPYTTGRAVINGLLPLKKLPSYDTKKVAKRNFGYTSNKLDDIAKLLGLGTKIPIHYEVWDRCEKGDAQAWKLMKKYNARDTKLLEQVYLKFRAWDQSHVNMNLLLNRSFEGCPACGGKDTRSRGYNYTKTGRRPDLECMNPECGRRFVGKHEHITNFR